ncbi:MAG: radical SAM protein [Bacillota bacterium]
MKNHLYIEKNEDGSLNIPKSAMDNEHQGRHGEYIFYEENGKLILAPSIHSVQRLYIEPTAACNLNCVTCIRKTWTEEMGSMKRDEFDKLLLDIEEIETLDSVMFGGFGEPTHHPDIYYMIKSISDLGIRTEMTTNGTKLTEKNIMKLMESGLKNLWVSVDSMEIDKFNEIREGADFAQVFDNLMTLKRLNRGKNKKLTLGIAFVVTKDNAEDLSRLKSFATKMWAEKISVSNVIPYDQEMEDKMLCKKTLFKPLAYRTQDVIRKGTKEVMIPEISLPRIDYNNYTKEGLYDIHASMMKTKTLGEDFREYNDYCRFVNEGMVFVRWDGEVAPCMGLLHSYTTFLNGNKRLMKEHTFGNIKDKSLKEIWEQEEYREFRQKVYDFEFSPCVLCGGCEDVDSNDKDCLSNTFPACGGCLWAQGVIQCP